MLLLCLLHSWGKLINNSTSGKKFGKHWPLQARGVGVLSSSGPFAKECLYVGLPLSPRHQTLIGFNYGFTHAPPSGSILKLGPKIDFFINLYMQMQSYSSIHTKGSNQDPLFFGNPHIPKNRGTLLPSNLNHRSLSQLPTPLMTPMQY